MASQLPLPTPLPAGSVSSTAGNGTQIEMPEDALVKMLQYRALSDTDDSVDDVIIDNLIWLHQGFLFFAEFLVPRMVNEASFQGPDPSTDGTALTVEQAADLENIKQTINANPAFNVELIPIPAKRLLGVLNFYDQRESPRAGDPTYLVEICRATKRAAKASLELLRRLQTMWRDFRTTGKHEMQHYKELTTESHDKRLASRILQWEDITSSVKKDCLFVMIIRPPKPIHDSVELGYDAFTLTSLLKAVPRTDCEALFEALGFVDDPSVLEETMDDDEEDEDDWIYENDDGGVTFNVVRDVYVEWHPSDNEEYEGHDDGSEEDEDDDEDGDYDDDEEEEDHYPVEETDPEWWGKREKLVEEVFTTTYTFLFHKAHVAYLRSQHESPAEQGRVSSEEHGVLYTCEEECAEIVRMQRTQLSSFRALPRVRNWEQNDLVKFWKEECESMTEMIAELQAEKPALYRARR